jgi:putative restriction endonuclease
MKSEGWWTLIDHQDEELGETGQLRSIGKLREQVHHAVFDSDLWSEMMEKNTRDNLRSVLFSYHFQPEMASILAGESNINIDAHHYMKNLMEHKEIDYDSISKPIRDAGFRRSIQRVYDHTCAMTGQRIIIEGRTSIDACHIVPWSVSHNDAIDNGIALSKNCHWAFDNGLLSIDDNYSVVVSSKIKRHEMNSSMLAGLDGNRLILPQSELFRPNLEYISAHRKKKF